MDIPRERLPGWERRLNDAITAARALPYELGTHDCFRFACAVIQALTGADRWPEFAGRYTTRREAMVAMAAYGSNYTAAGTAFFGVEPVSWKMARRGDILEFREPEGWSQPGEVHLVVCNGDHALGLRPEGLTRVPLNLCAHAWRVG